MRPGTFMQVLQLITNVRSQMRLIRYIGLTRTGLTTKMVSKISRAVASIPIPYDPAVHMPPPRLEIQKVDCTAIAFLLSTSMKIDMELSRRCSLTLRRCKNCSLHAVRRVSNWSRLLQTSSTFLRPNESTRPIILRRAYRSGPYPPIILAPLRPRFHQNRSMAIRV